MKSYYPSIRMKVIKDLYLEVQPRRLLREEITEEENVEIWSDEKVAWTTKKCDNNKGIIKEGRYLSFKHYWYAILNTVTEEDNKSAMIIVMKIFHSHANANYPLGQAEFHPYELNNLIKEGVIEIV